MLFALDVRVNKKAPPALIVCLGVSTPHPPPPNLKKITPSFAKSSLKSVNYPSPLFRRFTSPPPPKTKKIHAPPSPKKSDFLVNSHPSHLLTVAK